MHSNRRRISTRSNSTNPEDDEIRMNDENEIRVEAEIHPPPKKSAKTANLQKSSSRRGGRSGGRTTEPSSLRSGKSRMNKAPVRGQGRRRNPVAAQAVRGQRHSQVRDGLQGSNEFELNTAGETEGTNGSKRSRAAGRRRSVHVCGVPTENLGEPQSGHQSNRGIPKSKVGSGRRRGGGGDIQHEPNPEDMFESEAQVERNSESEIDELDERGVCNFEPPQKRLKTDKLKACWEEFESQRSLLIDQLLQARQPKGNSNRRDCVPEFYPIKNTFTTMQWINTLEQFKRANSWNEANLIYHMQSQLRGTAKTWFDGLENYDRSWEEWKAALLLNFPDDQNHAERFRLMDLRKKKPEETYEEYFFEKMKLMRPCKLTPAMSVDFIIEGILDNGVKLAAKMKGCTTPEELLQKVILQIPNSNPSGQSNIRKCFECGDTAHMRNKCPRLKNGNSKQNRPEGESHRASNGKSRNQNFGNGNQKPDAAGNQQGNSERERPKCEKCKLNHPTGACKTPENGKRESTCFNCKKKGHRVRDCPEEKLECSKCGWFGHESEQCPRIVKINLTTLENKLNKKNETEEKIDNEVTEVAKGYTECYLQDTLVIGFVDSGSESTLVKKSLAISLGIKFVPCNTLVLGYGNVVSCRTVGKAREMIQLGTCTITVDIYIVSDDTQDESIIIGRNILELEDVASITHKGKWWFFEPGTLGFKDEKREKKICLRTIKDEIIPPLTVKYCQVTAPEKEIVYIEDQLRQDGLFVPTGVTETNGTIPIANLSKKSIRYKKGRVVTRAMQAQIDKKFEEENITSETIKCFRITNPKPFTMEEIKAVTNPELPESTYRELHKLINDYRDCFAENLEEIGCSKIEEFSIELKDTTPVTYRPYRLSHAEREFVKTEIEEMKKNGIIRDSSSPYASPILLVRKKNGEQRMCIDFRRLNLKTVKDRHPIPRIDDLLDRISGGQFFSSLDLASGYWQIPVSTETIPKTAFVTPDGQYECLRMPFGVTNGPATFQRMMNKLFKSQPSNKIFAYIDDILATAKSIEEALSLLEKILKLLRESGLTLRLSKCRFLKTELSYLGHEIQREGLRPSKEKIKAVSEFPTPKDVHTVRQFLGLAGYFRKFIKGFSKLTEPLTQLLQKKVQFEWKEEQEKAFQNLKEKLTERPILAVYNPHAETELHTDASSLGIGSTLLQKQSNGMLQPIAYFSQSTTYDERRYHSYELETLAIVRSLQKFRVYLFGKSFKIVTDCSALRYTLTKKDLVPRIARWWLLIQEFDFEIEYRPNCRMRHVDALSRNPIEEIPESFTETVADKSDIIKVKQLGNRDWVKILQSQDEKCRYLYQVLKKKTSSEPREKEIFENYRLINGRIFRKTELGNKWVVPMAVRKQILSMQHDDGGHPGIKQTEELVRRKFWFPKLRQYVKDYVSSCIQCALSKPNRGVSSGPLHPIEKKKEPFDTIHLDHIGPFIKTARGYKYLLVAVDAFTKYTWLFPVTSTTTRGVIMNLDKLFNVYGIPRRLICDRGSAFTSKSFTEYCNNSGIQRVLTAVATPRANGQCERINATVLERLTAVVESESTWDKYVPLVMRSINNCINEATRKAPHELLHGYQMRTSSEAPLVHEIGSINSHPSIDHQRHIKIIREEASKNIQHQSNKMSQRTADRKPARKFKVNELVYIRSVSTATGESNKLKYIWKGIYRVTEILPNDRYRIRELGPGYHKYNAVHSSENLKHFNIRTENNEDDISEDY